MRRNISAVNYEEEQRPELVMEDKRQAREQLIFLEAMFKYWSVTESVFREGNKKKRTSAAENVLALTQTAKSKWESDQAGKWVFFYHFELNIVVYYTHKRFIQMYDYLTNDASKPNKTNVLLLRVLHTYHKINLVLLHSEQNGPHLLCYAVSWMTKVPTTTGL